jgi:hypothetical protein
MKYPIGIQEFEKIINGGYVYVDKTALIYRLVTEGSIYFLSRPRRFGKSLLVSTLEAYFKGKKELFKGLAIDSMEKEWAEHPVFHLSFGGENFLEPGSLEKKIGKFLADNENIYGKNPNSQTIGSRFSDLLKAAHQKYGRRAVVLIDEYDKPLLDVLDTNISVTVHGQLRLQEEHHRNILKGFYSVFKEADKDLQFVFLTGVTKFSQVSVFSGFNQPADISLDGRYEALCGITTEELHSYFKEPIKTLAQKYKYTEEEMKAFLKKQYDGYHFGENLIDIYNPFSILNAFSAQKVDDYWFRSGTPSYLVRLLNHTQENLNELTNRYYTTQQFIDYKADMEMPLPMIYQSGYLTVKDCNLRRNTYLLDFPNDEVKNGFISILANDYLKPRKDVNNWTQDVIDALESANLEQFRKLLTSFLADIPYSMRRKEDERERERYFHYTFYLLMRMVSCYTVYTEKQQSEGRVDCIVETPDYIYIFEFKLDGTADEALQQIEEKGYARPYEADSRKLFKVGTVFSSETGTVSEFKIAE